MFANAGAESRHRCRDGDDRPDPGARTARVGAVVVSYRPDPIVLARVLGAVAPQVEHVVLVANGPEACPPTAAEGAFDLSVLALLENQGIAAAQNLGVERLRRLGIEFVLFLDQDSVCGAGMVETLVTAARRLVADGVKVAAVAPQYRTSPEGQLSGFVRFGSVGVRRLRPSPDSGAIVEADFLISSGTLVPLASLDVVGGMDESFFIDHVDTEWLLRARAAAHRCFGVPAAVMEHGLGDGGRRVWLGRWRYVPDHRPFRYYYIVRNSVLLYRRSYAPWRWIVGDVLRLSGLAVVNLILRDQRVDRLRMMVLGIRHGIVGRVGPLEPSFRP